MLDISNILKECGRKQELNIELNIEELELNYDHIILNEKIKLEGYIENIDDVICLNSKVFITFPIQCYSCGEEFVFSDNIQVDENFMKNGKDDEYVIQGNEIDLEKAITDNLVLKLPTKFICKKDCKGICPICMKNRNKVSCNCNNLITDPRFDKLKQLLK